MGSSFDNFAKRLATGQSRRLAIKRVATGLVGGAMATALVGKLGDVSAQTTSADLSGSSYTLTPNADGTYTVTNATLAGATLVGARLDKNGQLTLVGATVTAGWIANQLSTGGSAARETPTPVGTIDPAASGGSKATATATVVSAPPKGSPTIDTGWTINGTPLTPVVVNPETATPTPTNTTKTAATPTATAELGSVGEVRATAVLPTATPTELPTLEPISISTVTTKATATPTATATTDTSIVSVTTGTLTTTSGGLRPVLRATLTPTATPTMTNGTTLVPVLTAIPLK